MHAVFFGKIGMLVTLIYMYTHRCTENCLTNKVVRRIKKRETMMEVNWEVVAIQEVGL